MTPFKAIIHNCVVVDLCFSWSLYLFFYALKDKNLSGAKCCRNVDWNSECLTRVVVKGWGIAYIAHTRADDDTIRLPRRETYFCLSTLVGLTKKEEIRREKVSLTPTHSVKQSDREREGRRERERNTQELAPASAALKWSGDAGRTINLHIEAVLINAAESS